MLRVSKEITQGPEEKLLDLRYIRYGYRFYYRYLVPYPGFFYAFTVTCFSMDLKGQCHEMVSEMSPWSSSLGLN
jgi:hypothetical protein